MRGGVVIATGGTGGHMFPALALGDVLARRGHQVTFAVDPRGVRYLDPERARLEIDATSPSGTLLNRGLGFARLGLALGGVMLRFLAARPKAVAALGGYASVPTGLAAGLLRVPLVLHEQNAVLGRAHRLLTRFAKTLALTFETTKGVPDEIRTVTVGNPVRSAFQPAPLPTGERLELLVTGGSQGAQIFADVVPEALGRLPAALRARLHVTQQCRPEDLERVEAAYRGFGLAFEVRAFFDDMPERLARAGLVICRSGASSVAELLVVGRPAILVPYPYAADDHQRANAEALADTSAAILVDADAFTPQRLAQDVRHLMSEPNELQRMAAAADRLARPDAGERLADVVEEALA